MILYIEILIKTMPESIFMLKASLLSKNRDFSSQIRIFKDRVIRAISKVPNTAHFMDDPHRQTQMQFNETAI